MPGRTRSSSTEATPNVHYALQAVRTRVGLTPPPCIRKHLATCLHDVNTGLGRCDFRNREAAQARAPATCPSRPAARRQAAPQDPCILHDTRALTPKPGGRRTSSKRARPDEVTDHSPRSDPDARRDRALDPASRARPPPCSWPAPRSSQPDPAGTSQPIPMAASTADWRPVTERSSSSETGSRPWATFSRTCGPSPAARTDLPDGAHRPGGLRVEIPDGSATSTGSAPTPLFRARRPKRSSIRPRTSTTSTRASLRRSHKPNSAIPQAYANKRGVQAPVHGDRRRPVGLGARAGLQPVRARVRGLHGRRELRPEALPARDDGDLGRHGNPLAERHDRGGPSRGVAPDRIAGHRDLRGRRGGRGRDEGTNYALGSVLNHVCLHQTVIGQEAIAQMEMAGEEPDVVVGCVGGGSNFAGLSVPVPAAQAARRREDALPGRRAGRLPDPDRGAYRYDFGDTSGITPLMPMYTLGHDSATARPRRRAPLPRRLADRLRAGQAGPGRGARLQQNETFDAALRFARTEGIVPAEPRTRSGRDRRGGGRQTGRRGARDPARAVRSRALRHVRLRGLPGGTLEDAEFSEADMEAALDRLPDAPAIA